MGQNRPHFTTLTLGDLYDLKTVEGIAFWCNNHACQHHDSAPVGVLTVDYGGALTLPDMEAFSYRSR